MKKNENIAHLRKSYEQGVLSDNALQEDPFVLFDLWFKRADAEERIEEANAMTLATLDEQGYPKARVVLLKQYGAEGFVFYTNYNSQKGKAIAHHPQVSLSFFWPALEQQIIIRGKASRIAAEASDAYFNSRPLGSQLGAIASSQSQMISSREQLEERLAELQQRYTDTFPQRPSHWGGYNVVPQSMEFWQGRPNRLHDRIEFIKTPNGQWLGSRLAP